MRCSPQPQPQQWACSGRPATTSLITPARRRWLSSHASNQCRSWSMTPGIRLAVTLVYSARHNGGGGHAPKPASPSLPPYPLLGAAPLATPPHSGPPGVGEHSHSKARHGSQSPVETAQNVPVHFGSKVRHPVETAQNVPVHFLSKVKHISWSPIETAQNVRVHFNKPPRRQPHVPCKRLTN
jgi:hypothetical protein